MKGPNDRPHARPSGALWLGAPLVLAACVAAEAAPQAASSPDRLPAQVRLSRLVRDGVARLARSTRPAIGPAHVTFVLFALERVGGAGLSSPWCVEPSGAVPSSPLAVRAFPLNPGRTSSPIAAP